MRKPVPISEVIKTEIRNSKNIMEEMLRNNWKEIIGEALAKKSYPLYTKGTILYIGVENSVWIQQMQFFKRDIIENINNFLNGKYIKDIQFKNSEIQRRKEFRESITERIEINKINTKNITLTQNEINVIEKTAEGIKDEKIREKFLKVIIENKKREIFLMKDGGKKCEQCGEIFFGSDRICSSCKKQKKDQYRLRAASLIEKKPGITYFEAKEIVREIDKEMFNEAKRKILARLKDKIYALRRENKIEEMKKTIYIYFMIELESDNKELIVRKSENLINSFT